MIRFLYLLCGLWLTLAVAVAQDAASEPGSVGTWWEDFVVPPGGEGAVRMLRVEKLEPLSVMLGSWTGDVRVSVEDQTGRVLARDDNGSLVPDALLHWTPPSPGIYYLRAQSRSEAPILAVLGVLRGHLDPTPPNKQEYQRAYWHLALVHSFGSGDQEWMERSIGELCLLEEHAGAESLFARWGERNALLERYEDLFGLVAWKDEEAWSELNKLERADRASWRAVGDDVVLAIDELRALPDADSDPVVAFKLFELGFVAGWLERYEASGRAWAHALEFGVATLPDWHPDLHWLRYEYAGRLAFLGRRFEALQLEQEAVAISERIYPPLDREVLRPRANLALSHKEMGDVEGATAEFERLERLLAGGELGTALHAEELYWNMADCYGLLGRHDDAARARERTLELLQGGGVDELTVLEFELEVGIAELESGRIEASRIRLELAFEGISELVGPLHSSAQIALYNLARLGLLEGDLESALQLADQYLAGALEGGSSVDRADAEELLAEVLDRVEEAPGAAARAPLPGEADALRISVLQRRASWMAAAWTLPLHLAQALAGETLEGSGDLLRVARQDGAERSLQNAAFTLIESARMLTAWDQGPRQLDGVPREELAARRHELLAALARSMQSAQLADPSIDVGNTAMDRDVAQGRLRALIGATAGRDGVDLPGVDEVAGSLDPGEAAAGWFETESEFGRQLCGWVLFSGGELRWLDPVPTATLTELVTTYRHSIGAPVGNDNAAAVPADEDSLLRAGAAVRELVLDPIWSVAREPGPSAERLDRLYVCLAGDLRLIDLETLPLESGTLVGDQTRIFVQPSVRALVHPAAEIEVPAALLLVHGVDYGAAGEGVEVPGGAQLRTGGFGPLPYTRVEAEAVGARWRARWPEGTVRSLEGGAATKAAFVQAAEQSRFLHLATHGYYGFVDLGVARSIDAEDDEERVRRLAASLSPFTFSGLALAGAGRGGSPLERLSGLLSSEELLGLDLSGCELLVASACHTAAGMEGGAAAEGLAVGSFRAAAHAAGVQGSVTSLWAVDDRKTAQLMEQFYRLAWSEGRSYADALWETKRALWDARESPRQYAAWVFSGEP